MSGPVHKERTSKHGCVYPEQVIRVETDGREYDVRIGQGLLGRVSAALPSDTSKVIVIADETVAGLYEKEVLGSLREQGRATALMTFPAGERHKNRETKRDLEDRMLEAGVDRDGVVVALGGGVTSDLAGFVAATYLRGIPYLNLPTSLLAMVDATVGGKTGVNTKRGKNLVGAFHQPLQVLADLDTLTTLPESEMDNGLSEMVKHAVIADAGYLAFLEENSEAIRSGSPEACGKAVFRSVSIKKEVVEKDIFERNYRQVLNFGHTVGHAIEQVLGFSISHGHAVSIGMAVEVEIAVSMGICEKDSAKELTTVLERLCLPCRTKADKDEIVRAMISDKKKRKDRIFMALPSRLGAMASEEGRFGIEVPLRCIEEALDGPKR